MAIHAFPSSKTNDTTAFDLAYADWCEAEAAIWRAQCRMPTEEELGANGDRRIEAEWRVISAPIERPYQLGQLAQFVLKLHMRGEGTPVDGRHIVALAALVMRLATTKH